MSLSRKVDKVAQTENKMLSCNIFTLDQFLQTDASVLDHQYPQKQIVSRLTSLLQQFYDHKKIQLTPDEDLLERKYFAGNMPLLTLIHSVKTFGGSKV